MATKHFLTNWEAVISQEPSHKSRYAQRKGACKEEIPLCWEEEGEWISRKYIFIEHLLCTMHCVGNLGYTRKQKQTRGWVTWSNGTHLLNQNLLRQGFMICKQKWNVWNTLTHYPALRPLDLKKTEPVLVRATGLLASSEECHKAGWELQTPHARVSTS